MNQRTWQYNFDFVAFPSLAVGLTAYDCRSMGWLLLASLGVALFTFTEYWTHRIALHEILWHSQHQRHHTHPDEYSTFPVWYTPAIFAGFFLILPLPVFAGFVAGYCWFLYWHDILHHYDMTRLPRAVQKYAIWHLAHHKLDNCNFGITIPLWDWAFGTYRRAA
jgi:dihydroceramide fatty acyl 2-hydroxylase